MDYLGNELWDNNETHNNLEYGTPTASELDLTLVQFDHVDDVLGLVEGENTTIGSHALVTGLMEDDLRHDIPGPVGSSYKLANPEDIFF
jgi:hypothetical protein